MAVPVEIDQLGCHIAIFMMHNLFGEPAFPVTEEGLHAAKMASHHDIRKPITVDVTGC